MTPRPGPRPDAAGIWRPGQIECISRTVEEVGTAVFADLVVFPARGDRPHGAANRGLDLTTPAQRLAWLEDMRALALAAGALPRPPSDD
ncbi:hypothetical protein L6Q96_20295 [Candidatus Binatia bacterium]|nr:hypothetical protein [Candidatus Binatia bacterium]